MNSKLVAPTDDVDEPLHQRKCTRYDLSVDLDFEGGYRFRSPLIFSRSVCLCIFNLFGDRSVSKVHKTCKELSNSCVVLLWIRGSNFSSLSTFSVMCFFILRVCTALLTTLSHCTFQNKDKMGVYDVVPRHSHQMCHSQ